MNESYLISDDGFDQQRDNMTSQDKFESDVSYRLHRYILTPGGVVSVTLSLCGILLNCLTLVALRRSPNRLNTHYRLLASLAASDALVPFSVFLFQLNRVLNPGVHPGTGSDAQRVRSRCAYIVIKALNSSGLNMSLLNLIGMSVDHYLAITRPLRYDANFSMNALFYKEVWIYSRFIFRKSFWN